MYGPASSQNLPSIVFFPPRAADDEWTITDLEAGTRQQLLKLLDTAPAHVKQLAEQTLRLRSK